MAVITSKRINIILPDKTIAVLDRITTKGNNATLLTSHCGTSLSEQAKRTSVFGPKRKQIASADHHLALAAEWIPLEDESFCGVREAEPIWRRATMPGWQLRRIYLVAADLAVRDSYKISQYAKNALLTFRKNTRILTPVSNNGHLKHRISIARTYWRICCDDRKNYEESDGGYSFSGTRHNVYCIWPICEAKVRRCCGSTCSAHYIYRTIRRSSGRFLRRFAPGW
jgi:hypothetical protein